MRGMRAHMPHMHACSYVRVHHAMCRPQANWLSLFPDPSFVQCRPRSASLGPSGVVAGGATIEQCAQHEQESEVMRLVFIRSDAPVFVVFVQSCSDAGIDPLQLPRLCTKVLCDVQEGLLRSDKKNLIHACDVGTRIPYMIVHAGALPRPHVHSARAFA